MESDIVANLGLQGLKPHHVNITSSDLYASAEQVQQHDPNPNAVTADGRYGQLSGDGQYGQPSVHGGQQRPVSLGYASLGDGSKAIPDASFGLFEDPSDPAGPPALSIAEDV